LLGALILLDWASTVPEPIRKGLVELSKVIFSILLDCLSANQDQLRE
jgi:hypothetical protein